MSVLAPLGRGAVHVAVDLQKLFAEPGAWHVPQLSGIVPAIAALAGARPEKTLFTRFVVPPTAEAAIGHWQTFYGHWADFTGQRLPRRLIELVDGLAPLAASDRVFDKLTYSAFKAESFVARLAAMAADTLIITGVETDVCVLATILDAVDLGLRVVAVCDALASSSLEGHESILRHVLPRYDRQVDMATLAQVLVAWDAVPGAPQRC